MEGEVPMTATASATQSDFFVADPITRNPPVPSQPSRWLVRYVLAISFGVAATLAWQSYGQTSKQMIATRAPDLAWSPEAKQKIASWVEQLGWTKLPADAENTPHRPIVSQTAQPAKAATALDTFATKESVDPQQIHQMALDLGAVRQTLEQVSASQTKMADEINNLLVTDMEMFLKIPAPPSAAAPRKSTPVAPPLRAPNRRTDLIPDQSLADNFRN
jgi:hypothetical protein